LLLNVTTFIGRSVQITLVRGYWVCENHSRHWALAYPWSSGQLLLPRRINADKCECIGTCPGKNWVRCFISHHSDILVAKPRRLELKPAQNFNKATIMEYLDMRTPLNQKHDGTRLRRMEIIHSLPSRRATRIIFAIFECVLATGDLAIWRKMTCYTHSSCQLTGNCKWKLDFNKYFSRPTRDLQLLSILHRYH
jgi:hypothetical protein